ncbi:hypothetical protein HanIR_Chr17g0846541 [Helianthus annuus]|nr:hypothetical protein HanIR_Chr17g0846541 [Helianthus annuus]
MNLCFKASVYCCPERLPLIRPVGLQFSSADPSTEVSGYIVTCISYLIFIFRVKMPFSSLRFGQKVC